MGTLPVGPLSNGKDSFSPNIYQLLLAVSKKWGLKGTPHLRWHLSWLHLVQIIMAAVSSWVWEPYHARRQHFTALLRIFQGFTFFQGAPWVLPGWVKGWGQLVRMPHLRLSTHLLVSALWPVKHPCTNAARCKRKESLFLDKVESSTDV